MESTLMKANEMGRLIRGITANINLFIGSKIEKLGLSQGQYEYFLLIYSTPGINQLELSTLKNVGKASVTKALKILERDGFVKRVTDQHDKRHSLCYVTPKGEAIVQELLGVRSHIEADLFEGFTSTDLERFNRYLVLLHRNAQKLVTLESVNTND
jgi:DNA-binding MarR family transcriptional regulator